MKRSFIAISVATIIGLSACSTKVSSSTSMNSPISTSVTSEQEFLSNLENASTSQVLQKLKESDGGYTEDCFSVLTNRLIKFPQGVDRERQKLSCCGDGEWHGCV